MLKRFLPPLGLISVTLAIYDSHIKAQLLLSITGVIGLLNKLQEVFQHGAAYFRHQLGNNGNRVF
jgi:hypothetical protein